MSFVQIHRTPEKARVVMQTDLVAEVTVELRPVFRELVNSGVKTLNLDMAATRRIDSHGIGLLVATCNSLGTIGGELVLDGVSAPILGLFQTLQLTKRFRVNPA